jgi:hypothetical protein
MKISSTNEDLSRSQFVQGLYKSLKKQTEIALSDHKKWMEKTAGFIQDGLDNEECEELLVIEGLSRKVAKSYVEMVQSDVEKEEGLNEYSFQFEDVNGKVWSAYDIGRVIYASTDDEAWEKAEETIFENSAIEPERIISVDRIS